MPTPRSHLGQELAAIAEATIGHCYLYGGVPGPNFDQCWDCSSAVNSWVGHYGAQSIPGYPNGSYDGRAHGPNTTMWLADQGNTVGSIPRSALLAGDIVCWTTHMGLAISNTEMVSAENPADGTRKGTIDGFMPGEPLVCLRLAVIGPGGVTFPSLALTGGADIAADTRIMARELRAKVDAAMRIRNVGRHGLRV